MSVSMHFVSLYLRVRSKRHFATVGAARKMLAKEKTSPAPPAQLRARHSLSYAEYGGFQYWTVEPRDLNSKRTVVYLHGGAYVNEIFPQHWNFIEQIADAGARVVVPLYGLAPQHNYKDAYHLLAHIYRDILSATRSSDIVIAGDSAGGGLALGFAQSLAGIDLPQPGKLLLISPWLDLSLENPDIKRIARKDPWLSVPGTRECARAWSAGDDMSNPQLSPINGHLPGLAPMDIYIGTRDILLPDVLLLQQFAASAGTVVNVTVCPEAVHVYPLTPTREGRAESARIVLDLVGDRSV